MDVGMDLTELDTDVREANGGGFADEAEDETEIDLQHYELDEPRDLKCGRSLEEGIYLPTQYIVGYAYEGPPSEEAKKNEAYTAIQNGNDPEEAVSQMPDTVRGAQVFHSNEDGELGHAFASKDDKTLDEIIDEFVEARSED